MWTRNERVSRDDRRRTLQPGTICRSCSRVRTCAKLRRIGFARKQAGFGEGSNGADRGGRAANSPCSYAKTASCGDARSLGSLVSLGLDACLRPRLLRRTSCGPVEDSHPSISPGRQASGARLGDWARATAVLHVGLQIYRDDATLKKALKELAAHAGSRASELATTLSGTG